MERHRFAYVERNVARCRILLSVLAMLAVYVDPTQPTLTRWLPLRGGPMTLDPYTLAAMGAHLAYALAVYVLLTREVVPPARVASVTTWADVLFGAAIALVTEGATSPFYAFFSFAVLTVGFRAGFRPTMVVTAVSVVLYLSLIAVSAPDVENLYIMRPAYLAITGYLVGYLGQQRLMLEDKIRGLEAGAQREAIARSLHDNYVQALSGVNLQIGICRELMRRGRGEEASDQLADLQACVNREHDGLRTYINSLLDRETERSVPAPGDATRFSVTASFSGSHFLVEHVLQIMLEGSRNVSRHACASGASIDATATDFGVRITVDDDGVGFRGDAGIPWSIASRVTECDGRLEVNANGRRGAHLLIELPEA